MESIILSPDPAFTNDEIIATADASDIDDGDTVTFSYQWKNNGENIGSDSDTLSSDNFIKGNEILVIVTPNDGTENGEPMTSEPLIISNSIPTQPTVSIEPSPAYANNDLTCIPSGSTDTDNDPFSYEHQWYKNGAAEEHSNTVLASHTTAGDVWKCEVVAYDGENRSSVGWDSATILEVPDTTPPIIIEEIPVPTLTNNNTPNYIFISDEAGSITYYGSCGPCSNIQAIVGENIITFGPLADGVYGDCEIIVTDASGNPSNILEVSSFTIDTIAPVVAIIRSELITNQNPIMLSWTVDGAEFYEEVTLTEGENVLTKEATDAAGNTGSDSITVILDTTKPVISILGDNPLYLYVGDAYEEFGATAEDNVLEEITINSEDVDTSETGTYEVIYNVLDEAGNEADEVTRTVIVSEAPLDTTPPARSDGLPTGELSTGTTEATLSLTTDENAVCRYSNEANTEYGVMIETFNVTNLTDHSTLVTGLTSGSYTYYIRCQDDFDNNNADDYEISFSVISPPSGGGGGGGGSSYSYKVSSHNRHLKILSSQQGTLTQDLNNKNKVKVEIPKGSIKSTATFTASEGSLEEGDVPKDKVGAFLFNGLAFNINAVDSSKKAVREFSEDLTITLTVPDLPDDISSLELYYYDDEKEEWIIITGVVFGDGAISFKVDHLTKFAVFETNAVKTGEVKGETDVNIIDGDIIRNPNAEGIAQFDIYIVKIINDKKFKRLILSPHVFESYGHLDWNNTKLVNQDTMDFFTLSSLVRCFDPGNNINDPKVYSLKPNGDKGIKNHLNITAAEFEITYDWDAIYMINKVDRDAYGKQ